jgi:hypothetical protein
VRAEATTGTRAATAAARDRQAPYRDHQGQASSADRPDHPDHQGRLDPYQGEGAHRGRRTTTVQLLAAAHPDRQDHRDRLDHQARRTCHGGDSDEAGYATRQRHR